jgi:hypothetical protein
MGGAEGKKISQHHRGRQVCPSANNSFLRLCFVCVIPVDAVRVYQSGGQAVSEVGFRLGLRLRAGWVLSTELLIKNKYTFELAC